MAVAARDCKSALCKQPEHSLAIDIGRVRRMGAAFDALQVQSPRQILFFRPRLEKCQRVIAAWLPIPCTSGHDQTQIGSGAHCWLREKQLTTRS